MSWLRRFWFFWWDIMVSYVLGALVRRGAKILCIDRPSGQLWQGHASVLGEQDNRRCWYVRNGVNNEEVCLVYLDERGVTWVWGWEGEAADAFRAQQLLVESAA